MPVYSFPTFFFRGFWECIYVDKSLELRSFGHEAYRITYVHMLLCSQGIDACHLQTTLDDQ